MAVLASIIALLAAAPAVQVDTSADAASRCAPGASLAQALRALLPGMRVEKEGELRPGDLRAALRREGETWQLEVREQNQQDQIVALRRSLKLGEGECALAAETSALMVDRFLEEVRWPGRPASIEPLPKPPPPPEPPPPPLVPELSARAIRLSPPNRLAISLGPAAWLGSPSDLRAAALLSATLRLGESWQASLLALAGLASSEAVAFENGAAGATRVHAGLMAAELAACTEAAALRFCGGPLMGARGSIGSSSGTRIFQQSSALIVQPEAGAHAALLLRLSPRLLLSLDLLGGAALGSASFAVAGAGAQRTLPALDFAAAVRLGWEPL